MLKYLDEEFLTQQKERLLQTYNCNNIKEVIEILERKIKKKNEMKR